MRTLRAYLSQFYCRHSPFDRGKFRLWKSFFNEHSKHGMTVESSTIFGGNFEVNTGDYIQASIFLFGLWEPIITAYLRQTLKPGDEFIDIGANVGYYTVLAGRSVGPSGKVYAIEASPNTFHRLQRNIARNHLRNVEAHNVAVSDVSGEISLWITEERNLGRSTILETKDGRGRLDAVVKALPLDRIVQPDIIRNARVIKIDVEGAEWPVISGFRHILPEMSRTTEILVEVNRDALGHFGMGPDELIALFRHSGFVAYVINSQANGPYYPIPRGQHGIRRLSDELDRYDTVDVIFKRS